MKNLIAPILAVLVFLSASLPYKHLNTVVGRTSDRQAQSLGVFRYYCENSEKSFFPSVQLHYGNRPFTLEMTFMEWGTAKIARLFDVPCSEMTEFARAANALVFAAILLVIFLIANRLLKISQSLELSKSEFPTLFISGCLLFLSSDWFFLKNSLYPLPEGRAILVGLLAFFFSLKGRNLIAIFFWVLAFAFKPQIFLFGFIFSELMIFIKIYRLRLESYLKKQFIYVVVTALLIVTYFSWVSHINAESDLPWVTWMGSWHKDWFFGDIKDRVSLDFWKGAFLNAFRTTHMATIFAFFLLAKIFGKKPAGKNIHFALLLLPQVAAILVLQGFFYNAYKENEYYALPLHVYGALTLFTVLSQMLQTYFSKKNSKQDWVLVMLFVGCLSVEGLYSIKKYFLFIDDLKKQQAGLNIKYTSPFPAGKDLVVVALHGNQREVLHLYNFGRRGFMWCAQNEKFAPRKFWLEQGVKYIAWQRKDNEDQWTVRTIEEELAFAKQQGWSSDSYDPWSLKPMHEWANFASSHKIDPCMNPGYFDPRTWAERFQ